MEEAGTRAGLCCWFGVEPPAGIEPATPSLPWNHQEPLCGTPFPQVAPDRKGRSYGFSFAEVMRSLSSHAMPWAVRGDRNASLADHEGTRPAARQEGVAWLRREGERTRRARRYGRLTAPSPLAGGANVVFSRPLRGGLVDLRPWSYVGGVADSGRIPRGFAPPAVVPWPLGRRSAGGPARSSP
jgi:hypothetical protein